MKFSNSLVVFMALAGSGMLPATAHAVPADLAANVRALLDASYPADDARLRANVERDYTRSFHPTGAMRHMAAIVADGDRRARLKGVTAPTLVIHGADDPLVPVEGGRDTAESIPGATILEVPGMGHDLPLALVETIADAIAGHAKG